MGELKRKAKDKDGGSKLKASKARKEHKEKKRHRAGRDDDGA